MTTRTVLVGKNRRITLDELHSLGRREARLEVVASALASASAGREEEGKKTKRTTTRESIEAALDGLSLTDNPVDRADPPVVAVVGSHPSYPSSSSSSSLLSEGATIASLALLSLTLAQGRIVVGGVVGGDHDRDHDRSIVTSTKIADIVDVLKKTTTDHRRRPPPPPPPPCAAPPLRGRRRRRRSFEPGRTSIGS
ncbi:hypothetical protein ACHAW5_010679 [Stephanodiscus triporus]|uniref:Uncharacterized protein n=1 Tax=Stephanodiscus triporus TaxID=2934178 RepID=A0ABD3QVJ5_9STRA